MNCMDTPQKPNIWSRFRIKHYKFLADQTPTLERPRIAPSRATRLSRQSIRELKADRQAAQTPTLRRLDASRSATAAVCSVDLRSDCSRFPAPSGPSTVLPSNTFNASCWLPFLSAAERFDGYDWISCLPDDVLVVILSSLPLKESGRTSVLSSRWKNLWKQTSCLNFDASSALDKIARDNKLCSEERRKYVRWVNSVLKSTPHKGSLTLEHFRICFDVGKGSFETITKWLKFAFKRQVERLELNLLKYGDYQSLEHNEAIEFFLRNCTSLEQLDFQDIDQLSNLEVCGPSLMLKSLYARYCFGLVSVKVSAPKITSLAICTTKGLVLENVPMLADLDITCEKAHIPLLVPALSCCFSQLNILTLRLPGYKDHDIVRFNFPEMLELKKLVVDFTASHDGSILGLMTFIRISPNLEEFVLMINYGGKMAWASREVNKGTPFPHQHLKVFQYLGYYGRCSDMEVVMFILENCVGLQQIIIDPAMPLEWLHTPLDPDELEQEEVCRSYAKQQLEPIIPPHITFAIR